ncbi:hypothetical protein KKB40_05845, partial [Patescibacteria group bacterium]|nr:hypothetical protein [Patescibacteria group bacterium]
MSTQNNSKDIKFSDNAINSINSLFYSNCNEAFGKSGLADFFVKIEPVQFALAKKIEKLIPKTSVKIKELGAGTSLARWRVICDLKSERNWWVILTDFSKNSLPNLKNYKIPKNFQFSAEQYNLLEPYMPLAKKDKVDIILTTYGFDSVWFAEDAHYEKRGDKWFKAKYALVVDEGCSRKKFLTKVLKTGFSSKNLELKDFLHISIKKKLMTVDIKKVSYGKIIAKYCSHKSKIAINFPGGLIKKAIDAFETQIAEGGAFIIGDMAVNSREGFVAN